MEFQGTKGKWKYRHSVSKNSFKVLGTVVGGRFDISRCDYIINDNISDDINTHEKIEQQANALLISKAPEMLEMLNEIYKLQCAGEANDKHVRKRVLELIKQATEL